MFTFKGSFELWRYDISSNGKRPLQPIIVITFHQGIDLGQIIIILMIVVKHVTMRLVTLLFLLKAYNPVAGIINIL